MSDWFGVIEQMGKDSREKERDYAGNLLDNWGNFVSMFSGFSSEELLEYYEEMPRGHMMLARELSEVYESMRAEIRQEIINRMNSV